MGKSKAEQRREAIERLRNLQYVSINELTERDDEIAYAISDGEREVGTLKEIAYKLIYLLTDDEPDERYIELPVDSDGEVIHIGDEMERGTKRGRVIALMLSNYPQKWGGGLHWGVQLEGEQAPTALDSLFHHYHKPTVEDVLVEFAKKMHDASFVYDHTDDTQQRIVEEYAAKLQMREGQDEA